MFSSPNSLRQAVASGQCNTNHCLVRMLSTLTLFRMIHLDTFRRVTKKICICSSVILPSSSQRAVDRLYQSLFSVVPYDRPRPGRYPTFFVSSNRFHSLSLTLLVTPNTTGTFVVYIFMNSSVPQNKSSHWLWKIPFFLYFQIHFFHNMSTKIKHYNLSSKTDVSDWLLIRLITDVTDLPAKFSTSIFYYALNYG